MKFDNVLASLTLGEVLAVTQPIICDLFSEDIRVTVTIGAHVDDGGSEPILDIKFADDDSKVSYRLIHGHTDNLRNLIMDSLVEYHDDKTATEKKRTHKKMWHYNFDEYF